MCKSLGPTLIVSLFYVVESLAPPLLHPQVMTREGTRRIAQYAFEYAFLNNRSKVCGLDML